MSKVRDLVGQSFGRLTVVERAGSRPYPGGARWRCRCSCGEEAVVDAVNLRNGTASCGCLKVEQNRRQWRKEMGRSGQSYLYASYRNSARSRGLLFELSREEFMAMAQLPCRYCGVLPARVVYNHLGIEQDPESIRHSSFMCNGIDRVDNERGYVTDNTVPCCETCNRAKRTMTAEQFLAWARRVVAHNSSMGG